ncbi:glycosyl hydrolase family 17 protein [Piscirickettsia litoralis]|uniref:Endo-1,3-beta-glucanase btgC n=1 Tax=Piscirickettsia litoralis TaxID=1891921 RepID=A0ABX3A4D2_9GAMM|nr:glycosyl hydrolase family 17 protein [Piscirickettsia litoralis]ODN42245.1 hypothetical protein BGC07_03965 [Piscirickettsia litoralis]
MKNNIKFKKAVLLGAIITSLSMAAVHASNSSNPLPKFGAVFGDVQESYSPQQIKTGIDIISKHFGLIRAYDDFGGGENYKALMSEASQKNIQVILGIPNTQLSSKLGTVAAAKTYLAAHLYQQGTTIWPNLTAIIVGNETDTTSYGPQLAGYVNNLIAAINSYPDNVKNKISISIDFGPGLQENQNRQACSINPNIINAMKAVASNPSSADKVVFGNLYPFYAPASAIDLTTPQQMINQFAGTSTGWYPYSCAMTAMKNAGITNVNLSTGETGWATAGNPNGTLNIGGVQTQKTNTTKLNTYLQAYKDYINTPSKFTGVMPYQGKTSIFFEMFDEPAKNKFPWEPHFGLDQSIDNHNGASKPGITIPFTH